MLSPGGKRLPLDVFYWCQVRRLSRRIRWACHYILGISPIQHEQILNKVHTRPRFGASSSCNSCANCACYIWHPSSILTYVAPKGLAGLTHCSMPPIALFVPLPYNGDSLPIMSVAHQRHHPIVAVSYIRNCSA